MIELEKDKLKLWMAVCIISSFPGFLVTRGTGANSIAMIVGIAIFILGCTAIVSSDLYEKLKRKELFFYALKLALRIRIIHSLLIIAAVSIFRPHPELLSDVGTPWYLLLNVIDVFLVSYCVLITVFLLGIPIELGLHPIHMMGYYFAGTIFATVIYGILLSLYIFAVAGIIWCFLRLKHIISPTK